MPEALFDDLPILDELGISLRVAMERAESQAQPEPEVRRRQRRARFGWLGSLLVLGLVGTAAAAGTLTLLRGSPIPGPKAADTQPSMTPKDDSLRVLDLRAADPSGAGLPFALRVGESEAGQTCATVGQVDGGDFGIVGEDGRFRELPSSIVDACGDAAPGTVAALGARIFEARRWEDVRTVIYGAGMEDVTRVDVRVRGQWRRVSTQDGAFVAALRGYPEDSLTAVRLTTDDSQQTVRELGTSRNVVMDRGEGPAWTVTTYGYAGNPGETTRDCVSLRPRILRETDDTFPIEPICTRTLVSRRTVKRTSDYMIDLRALSPGDPGSTDRQGERQRWRGAARTVIYGWIRRSRVKTVTLVDGERRERLGRFPDGTFGTVLPYASGARVPHLELKRLDGRTTTISLDSRRTGWLR